jgi:ParB-like chromosome segregation protein Spo0J
MAGLISRMEAIMNEQQFDERLKERDGRHARRGRTDTARKNHAYANLFPLMTQDELDALTADVKENGLRQPIVLYGGLVLDGRNRFRACELAGVEPRFTEFEGDDVAALAFVESLNIGRRDLTAGQRAIVAARRWLLEGGGSTHKVGRPSKEENSPDRTVSLESLAKKYKVGKTSITQARDLLTEATDLAAQVEACTLSLAKAFEKLQERGQDAARERRLSTRAAAYREAISNGEMTLEEALRKALEQQNMEETQTYCETKGRERWHEELGKLVEWCKWGTMDSDDRIRWFMEAGSGSHRQPRITAALLDMAVVQILRVRVLLFGENTAASRAEALRRAQRAREEIRAEGASRDGPAPDPPVAEAEATYRRDHGEAAG